MTSEYVHRVTYAYSTPSRVPLPIPCREEPAETDGRDRARRRLPRVRLFFVRTATDRAGRKIYRSPSVFRLFIQHENRYSREERTVTRHGFPSPATSPHQVRWCVTTSIVVFFILSNGLTGQSHFKKTLLLYKL